MTLEQTPVSDGRSYGQLGLWLFGVLALLAVILVVLRIGELERFAALAQQAKPEWLLLAFALQCLTYVCAALVWYTALARTGTPHRLRSLIPLGIAKLFTDQVLPSGGISGTLLVMRGLERRKVPPPRAMGVLLVGLVSFYTAYGLAALIGLVVLQLHHTLGTIEVVIATLFAGFVVGVPSAVLSLRRLEDHPSLGRLRRVPGVAPLLKAVAAAPSEPLRDPVLMAKTITLQFTVFLLDAATLYVILYALDQTPSPLLAFASHIVADVVATIGPIPLGLGVFEGTTVVVLTMSDIPIEAALAAALLSRGLTFWLPMLPGMWLARRELAEV